MGREVLLFNRQINNKLSKTFFTFSLYFVFAGYRRRGGSPHPTQNQIPISNKRAALLLCAALLFFFRYASTHLLFFIASARPVFSIRINASACRYCLSPTGECVLKFSLYINLSVHCKLFALI